MGGAGWSRASAYFLILMHDFEDFSYVNLEPPKSTYICSVTSKILYDATARAREGEGGRG